MRDFARFTLFAAVLLLGSHGASAQVAIGIRIGSPPEPRVVYMHPPRPGPEFVWIDGYWYPVRGHYRWHEGYWTRPPYAGARWIGPRHEGGLYYRGYWEGDHGRFDHHHEWDHDHRRDYDRYHYHDHDHDHDEHH